ncbi:MAG TPA: carboxypeptidase-like regulatory domain-containing protein [Bryobacteraceae bacterium]|nr:carboxypeptidase-like regulatory domain-containing protein [Bryobacteraceae bacterium]
MHWLAIYILSLSPLLAAGISLHGRIVNDNDAPVDGALIRVRPAAQGSYAPIAVRSDPSGGFTLAWPANCFPRPPSACPRSFR